MTTRLLFILCYALFLEVSGQTVPLQSSRWQTTVDMGVQAGRVRPEGPVQYYGWYYQTPSYPAQRPAGNRIGLTIHATHSYILTNWIMLGMATGVDYYNNSAFFPLAASLRGNLFHKKRRVEPFYSLESGYAFRGPNPHDKELRGGWLWSPGMGVSINKGNGTGFLISAGYKHQEARHIAPVDGVQTLAQTEYRRYNRLYFRMGFNF
jgi:hypothetical protein